MGCKKEDRLMEKTEIHVERKTGSADAHIHWGS